jgi:iron complex transport system permease protein
MTTNSARFSDENATVEVPFSFDWKRKFSAILALAGLLVIVVIMATTFGSARIPFATCFEVLFSRLPFIDMTVTAVEVSGKILPVESLEMIILDVRLPRIILAGLIGMALSVTGATYQGLFRNPLADPYLLGVSAGAGLGATIAFLISFPISFLSFGAVPLFSFIGGILVIAVVYSLARIGKTLPVTTLILAGVATGAFFSSITSYLMTVSGEELHGILSWLMGGLSLTKWSEVWLVLPCVFIGIAIIFVYARVLNVMQLDEDQVQQLGINAERVKLILLTVATFITAAAVCFAGLIGFVGIIVPHAVRLIWGPDYRFLIPLSVFVGAIFLILADTAAHSLFSPTEIPVGVITAFCGAPFFLYLLRRRKNISFF